MIRKLFIHSSILKILFQSCWSSVWKRKWQPTPVFLPRERIPWTEEPGGLLSIGLHRVRHNWGDLGAAAEIQLLSHVQLFVTSWTAALQASLSFTISQGSLKPVSIGWMTHPTISFSVMPKSPTTKNKNNTLLYFLKSLFTFCYIYHNFSL